MPSRYTPQDSQHEAFSTAVAALPPASLCTLYRMLGGDLGKLYPDPTDSFYLEDIAPRVILANIFEGSYTADQLRPFFPTLIR